MREILFRGKRVDNEEWVEGIYYPVKYSGFSIPGGIDYYIITCFSGGGKSQIQVIPETVGQFTGLTDKNGVKIFEGDIVREKYFNDFYIGKVVFNKKTAGFEVWHDIVVGAYGEKATRKENFATCGRLEVIGNNSRHPRIVGEKQ